MKSEIKSLVKCVCLAIILCNFSTTTKSQCTPPMAETCEEANVICSLDELNGYSCNNPSSVPSPCSPLCSEGGVGHNTSWWGFVTQGGSVTITLEVGGCTSPRGAQFGIWGDCNCGEEIICESITGLLPNSIDSFHVNNLLPCKTYYFWLDGLDGDICDFTVYTSGGDVPQLMPLGFINNDSSGKLDTINSSSENVYFYIEPQANGCLPTYLWLLNGDEVGGNSNEIILDFPDEGDFTLCVTAYIGNPQSGSICSQSNSSCKSFKVMNLDSLELVKFYYALGGDNWINKSNWLIPDKPIQEWHGIYINSNKVESIILPHNNLRGSLYNFDFNKIRRIDLSFNGITGSLPKFDNINSIEVLELRNNNITGEFPEFNKIPKLKYLNLQFNQLSGSISNVSTLNNLETLVLSYNDLEGKIASLVNLSELDYLDISWNDFKDTFPNFSSLSSLRIMNLSYNSIFGSIPTFGNMPSLIELDVTSNFLKGPIANIPGLQSLNIMFNQYTFEDILSVQSRLSFFEYLPQKYFYVDTIFNTIIGEKFVIDLNIDNQLISNNYSWDKYSPEWKLSFFNSNFNKLIVDTISSKHIGRYRVNVTNSNIPGTLTSNSIGIRVCDRINDSIELVGFFENSNGNSWKKHDNWLIPNIPLENWYGIRVDNLGCVRSIDLNNNNLSGTLHTLNLNTLDSLILSNNKLNTAIPQLTIPFIKYLDLSHNNLTGELPGNVRDWLDLKILNLGFNSLNGIIPPDLGDLCELQELRLNNNNFTGELPDFQSLDNLLKMDLSYNQFSGAIPDYMGMPKLEELYLNGNQLSGLIPDFQNLPEVSQFRFYDNLFSGLIPEFTGMPKLSYTDLHDNYYTFSDIIPLISGSSNYIYSPQYPFYRDTTFIAEIGDQLVIDLLIDSTLKDNVYHWFKDSIPFTPPTPNDSNSNKLIFASIQSNDFGRYYVEVTNTRAPDLILRSRTIAIKVCDSEQDSLELVKLYVNTNGQNWINNENWLMDGVPIQSWYGISVDSSGCVSRIHLPNNGLTGDMGAVKLRALDSLDIRGNNLIGNITNWEFPFLKYYNVSQNQLVGSIDKPLTLWQDLEYLDVSDNLFTDSVPGAIGSLNKLSSLFLANNEFQFHFPVEITKLQAIELGQLDFKNNLQTAEALDPKFIFFCPYGDQIFANDSCFIPFQNLCNSICTGTEWDQLRNYPWMVDTLNAVKCSDSSCYETIIHAGNVEVRGIKLFFLRKRCFSDTTNNYYTEYIKYYNCNGTLIEEGYCDSVRNCYSMGETITEEHIKNGFYEIKWSCGDSLKINTNIKEYEDNSNKAKTKYKTLDCFPNPVIDLLQCRGFEGDAPKSLLVCNTQRQVFNPLFTIHDQFVEIHVESLVPGFYFGELKGLKTIYQFKFIVL